MKVFGPQLSTAVKEGEAMVEEWGEKDRSTPSFWT